MDQNALVKWALVAVAIYIAYRTIGQTDLGASAVVVGGGAGAGGAVGPNGGILPAPQPPTGDKKIDQTQVPGRDVGDVAGDVVDNERDIFGYPDEWRAGQATDRFYRQLWLPASKIPISALGKDDFLLAMNLIAGKVTRKGCPLTDLEARNTALNDLEDALGPIAIALASVAAALISVVSLGAGAAIGAVLIAATSYGVSQIPPRVDPDKLLPPHLSSALSRVLGPVLTVKQRGPTDPTWDHSGAGDVPPAKVYVASDGTHFYPRYGLFDQNVETWTLPWNSIDLGCKLGLRAATNLRARVYRALDVIACSLFPLEQQLQDPQGNLRWAQLRPYLYTYQSGQWSMVGSIFPPRKKDGDVPIPGHGSNGQPPIPVLPPQPAPETVAHGLTLQGPPDLVAPLIAAIASGTVALPPVAPPPPPDPPITIGATGLGLLWGAP